MLHRRSVRRLLPVLFVLCPVLALAQEDAGAPTGVLTRPPALTKQVEATFPPEMLDAGLGGTVVMESTSAPTAR